MKISEQIYEHLPVILQNMACSFIGRRITHERYGSDFTEILSGYVARLVASPAEVTAYAQGGALRFVRHATMNVPYYRRMVFDLGLSSNQLQSSSDISRLPILTKSQVQANLKAMRAEGVPGSAVLMHHTSGTTGTGLVFPSTYRAQQHQWAVWWRYRLALGITFDMWCGIFGGRLVVPRRQQKPPFWRINRPGRRVIFSGYHLRPEWLAAYVDEIKRRRLIWLHGYPSHLTLLAQFVQEQGVQFDSPIQFITTGAESLLEHQRQAISQAFGCPVRQHYGLAEASANVSECSYGTLHIDEDFSLVELLPLPTGDGLRLIGTNFTNPAFPLLRYDTGDIAYGLHESNNCACGRGGRTLDRIDGRMEDVIVLKDGTRVGRLDHILKDMVQVKEAQFVQKAPGKLILRLVRGAEFSDETERVIRDESIHRLGQDLELTFEYRDQLPRTGTSKLRFVVDESESQKPAPSP